MSDQSFDFLDTTENGNEVPLNERGIFSLLDAAFGDNHTDRKSTTNTIKRGLKKSYGTLETNRENENVIDITEKNSVLTTPFDNSHRIAKQKKRYISDISVYADLDTDCVTNDNESIRTNNAFLKILLAKLNKSDSQKHLQKLDDCHSENEVKKSCKLSELLVLGKQSEKLKLREQQRKTEKFRKHIDLNNPTRTINNKSHTLSRNKKRKPALKCSFGAPSDVYFASHPEDDDELLKTMKELDSSIQKNGNSFDLTLQRSLYNVFKTPNY